MTPQHRILVTGATGFVGKWLLPALAQLAGDQPAEIIAAGRAKGSDVLLDISEPSSVTRVLRDVRPTAIIHLAAVAAPHEAKKDPAHAWEVNFHGTINLALATLNEAPDCRFVYAGSSEAYGRSFEEAAGEPIGEETALRPMTVYGATKAASDVALGQMYFDGLRSIRFRPFNHTGPGQSDVYVVPTFASQVARIEQGISLPLIEVGNLSAHRDLLDVRDVVRAYALAAYGKNRHAEGEAFNLSSGKTVQIGRLLQILVGLSAIKIEVVVSPERVRPIDIPIACGNGHRAFAAFGWMPEFEMEDTLAAVLAEWRDRVACSSPTP